MNQAAPGLLVSLGIIAGVLVLLPVGWCGVCWLVGVLSGWWFLGRRFRWKGPLPPRAASMVSGGIGLCSYNGVLTIGADSHHLYLAVMGLFRPGHPPLRIPLAVVRATRVSSFFGQRVVVDLAGVTRLRIRAPLWDAVTTGEDRTRRP